VYEYLSNVSATVDTDDDKLQLAKDCGAVQVYNTRSTSIDMAERAKSTLVVSAAAPAYDTAIEVTARRGKVIAIGVPAEPVSFNCKS
jgi:D-arabinose 1-dehydrogenase-like Zn-dependent alcohol dehydrogenase